MIPDEFPIVSDSLSLLGIHEKVSIRPDEPQEWDLGDMELTFLRFDREVVVKQMLQNGSDVLDKLMERSGKYQYVIWINKDKPIQHISEDIFNEFLKNGQIIS